MIKIALILIKLSEEEEVQGILLEQSNKTKAHPLPITTSPNNGHFYPLFIISKLYTLS